MASVIVEKMEHTISAGYDWAQRNGVITIASAMAKIYALAIAALAVGGVVILVSTHSLPLITLSMFLKGSVDFVAGASNLYCCVRLFQKILHPQSMIVSWQEVAALVATLFVSTFVGMYMTCDYRSCVSLLKEAYKFASLEIGVITNLAMGMRMFQVVRRALNGTASMAEVAKELLVGIVTTIGINVLVSRIVNETRLSFHDLKTISAVVMGSGIVTAFAEKIAQVARKVVVGEEVPSA